MIQKAEPAQWPELLELWQEAFHDERSLIALFFSRLNRDATVRIVMSGGRIAAAAYLINTKLDVNGRLMPIWYEYALATRKSERGQGIMTEMLEEIRQEAASRGIPYTALLPSDDGLISFYQKRGYHSFFSSRTVSISRAQLTDWAAKRESDAPLCDYSELWDDAMTGSAGSVHWPLTAITRALSLNSVGGESVATMGDGFAIWREHDGCADVREWIAFRGRSDYLARGLRLRSDCDEFRFRLPVYSEDFPGQGVVHYAGMLRSTDGRPLPRCDGAYLGLELD